MLQGRMTILFMCLEDARLPDHQRDLRDEPATFRDRCSPASVAAHASPDLLQHRRDEARHAASFCWREEAPRHGSADPRSEKIAALKVLYFGYTGLNSRVGHPVNMLANRCKEGAEIGEMLPREALEAAIDQTYRRACRVFESLLGLTLREPRDIGEQLTALEAS
ncbi:MAG: hypothetical protein R3F14_07110 [Polyangiaceae bacterium]